MFMKYGTNAPKDVLADIGKMDKLEDMVRYALQLYQKSGVPSESEIKSGKNPILAEELRVSGNCSFQDKEYFCALESYNKSLCYSERGSKTMGLAFANRSAIYYKTGFYKLCLENIELALQNGYPEKLKFKLVKRKNDALYEMKQGREKKVAPILEPKLSYPAHPTIPFMVKGIEMKVNKKYGRHLVAKQGFNPGDILMIEKPLVTKLYSENVYNYCFFCLKSNFMSLLPCDEAISVMFCSEQCYKDSLDTYFRYEGPICDGIHGIHTHKIAVYRMLFEVICLVKDFDGLKEFFDSLDVNNKNPFEIHYKTVSKLDLFRSYFTLESHEKIRDAQHNLNLALEVAVMYHLISNYTDIKLLLKTKEHEDTLMKFLLRVSMTQSLAVKWIGKLNYRAKFTNAFAQEVSIGKSESAHLLFGLLNHSCYPNVSYCGEESQALIVMRPIKAGEQLFIYYGEFFIDTPKLIRQAALKKRYFFDCSCEACLKDWPSDNNIPTKGINCMELIRMVNRKPFGADKVNDLKHVSNLMKMCNDFIRKYDHLMPCEEVLSASGALEHCICMCYLEQPLEVTFKIC